MAEGKNTFKISVLNANKLIYFGEAKSLILTGDETEYELLPYHAPLLGVLRKSEIVIDNKTTVKLEKGLVRFYGNECIVLAEEKLEEFVEEKEEEEE